MDMPPLGWGSPASVRFWRLVDKRGPDECWIWKAAVVAKYGQFSSDDRLASGKKKSVKAHRFSWELANGRSVPHGMQVCHTCDVPTCVNPSHLFIGTALDNNADKAKKGRQSSMPGEANHNAKMTADLVMRIRATPEISVAAWAQELGLHYMTISDARRGRTWKHLQGF